MSVLVSLHASEYGNLLRKLKTNREILICDADIGLRVGWFFQGLGINGEEKRPFSDQEVESLVEHYKYFNAFFGKQGLLPIKKIKSMHTKLKENKIPEGEVKSSDQPSTQRLLLLPFSLTAEEALAAVKAHLLDNANPQNTYKIPKGLYRCEKCGEYKGVTKDKAVVEKSEEYLTVSCLCDGVLCHKCKKNKIHRPISNSYDEKDNDIIHHPYFSWMMDCAECRKK